MKKLASTSLIITFASLMVLLPPSVVQSADCGKPEKLFSSTYDVEFNFNSKGNAAITQKIALKNLSSNCFVSEFNLKVNSGKVQNVSGSDSLGTVRTSTKKSGKSTIISASLNDEVIGLGKSVVFTLKYTLVGLAKKEGTIWSVSVPNIVTSEKVTNYKLKVLIPKSFGEVFSNSMTPKNQTAGKDVITLIYDKEILDRQGVSLSFGNGQLISFELDLPLENKQFFSKKFFIPLPPDTENQKILIKSISPKPGKISLDAYGNYIAEYVVSARSLSRVSIKGIVKVVNKENRFSSAKILSEDEIGILKTESSFVQVQDSLIQEKANDLAQGNQIYKFTAESLTFDKNLIGDQPDRKGAAVALSRLQPATTVEFVDLFTALARAANIPTRQVVGIAISNDKTRNPTYVGEPIHSEKLHIWAQIYDLEDKIWLDVDPTWGSTAKQDYFGKNLADRFILLITDSDDGLDNLKNLTVLPDSIKASYTSEKVDFTPDVGIKIISDQVVAGFPADLTIELQNNSGVSLTQSKLEIGLDDLDLVGEKINSVDVVAPFQKKVLKFKVRGGDIAGRTEGFVTVKLTSEIDGKNFEIKKQDRIQIASFFSFGVQQFLLLVIIVLLIGGNFAPRLFPKK